MALCLSCGKELKKGFFAKNTDVPYPSNPSVCFACGMDGKTGEQAPERELVLSQSDSPSTERANEKAPENRPLESDEKPELEAPPSEKSGSLEPSDSLSDSEAVSEPSASSQEKIVDAPSAASDSIPAAPTTSQESQAPDASLAAISLLETVNIINAMCGGFLVVTFFIGGLVSGQFFLGLICAAMMVLVTAVIWAVNKVFLGIARDVREIRIASSSRESSG